MIGVTAALTCISITVIAIIIMKCKSRQRGRSPNRQETSLQESQPLDSDLKNPLEAVESCVEDTAGGVAERGIKSHFFYTVFALNLPRWQRMTLESIKVTDIQPLFSSLSSFSLL